jgi:hypothetical protein
VTGAPGWWERVTEKVTLREMAMAKVRLSVTEWEKGLVR